ncbi:hypothetical protein HELRODRAFT_165300 [Helobdella robusta]|uniref:Uncharacterized protein n=1 Tax=Helobdella robusta TaxID=6412 RepID=T1EWK2_HELRO|nr:hypothetical protein HELRODRAFT_165300 [Helobdella robusta]ESN91295.1 hypothetical protein HELRODRAFT_165300 [Helobdella robusta]
MAMKDSVTIDTQGNVFHDLELHERICIEGSEGMKFKVDSIDGRFSTRSGCFRCTTTDEQFWCDQAHFSNNDKTCCCINGNNVAAFRLSTSTGKTSFVCVSMLPITQRALTGRAFWFLDLFAYEM